jgi:hypothetical protein
MKSKNVGSPARSRRARGSSRRNFRVAVKFSAEELVAVRLRAAQVGLAVRAFIGQAAIDAAESPVGDPRGSGRSLLAEFSRLAGEVDRVVAVLERIATRVDSGEVLGLDLDQILADANKVLAQVDEAVLDLRRSR